MDVTVSETLYLAADLIEQRGWTTIVERPDPWGVAGGPLCLEGGIMAAAGLTYTSETPECDAYRAVWHFLENDERWPEHRDRLYDWNDAPNRTAAEVVGVLRAAAVVEAARESQPAEQVTR